LPADEHHSPLKGRLPFRLGTSSYIIPADILPNVRFLAPRVDDVELVLFESDEVSNIPEPAVVRELAQLGRAHDLTYTVHLPLDTELAAQDESERIRSVEKCLRVMQRLSPVQPFAYIVHFHGAPEVDGTAERLEAWRSQARQSMADLAAGVDRSDALCVETLKYPFEWVEDIVREFGGSVCPDVGHLLLNGRDVAEYLDRYLDHTRVIHLHGIIDGKDHASLAGLEESLLSVILSRLAESSDVPRVVTLEVFSQADFEASIDVLKRYLP